MKGIEFHNFEITAEFSKIGRRSLLINAMRLDHFSKESKLILLVIEDVTVRFEAERNLKETSENLSIVNQDLEQFAYVASHDLQEPLRTLSTHMELLRRRYADRLGSEGIELTTTAVAAAKRMQTLVKELLHFSQTSRVSLNSDVVDCHQIIENIKFELSELIKEANATIECESNISVETDAALFIQVFQNLISNAIKFRSTKAPHILIKAEKTDSEWIFSVSDNGIGIEEKYADRIFLIFQRLHGGEDYPGSGIGLAVCKKIIERWGGRIWFKSKIHEGTTFYFTIPLQTKNKPGDSYDRNSNTTGR